MSRNILSILFMMSTLFNAGWAKTSIPLQDEDHHFNLAPNHSYEITGSSFWLIQVNCTFSSSESQNKIRFKALGDRIDVNGQVIEGGQDITITVNSGEKMKIKSYPQTSIQIKNKDQHSITGSCVEK